MILDQTFIETAIFSLYKIDLLNLIKVKASLAKEFHIQPSELDRMPAWEYELFMKEINQAVKEENERNKAEMDKAGYDKAQKMSDPKYAQKMAQNQVPFILIPGTGANGWGQPSLKVRCGLSVRSDGSDYGRCGRGCLRD